MIQQFVPYEKTLSLQEITGGDADYALSIFDSGTISFFQHLSRELIRDPAFQRNPEIVSLSFWLRKANVDELKKQNAHLFNTPNVYPSPIGLVFHVCPANVDTMFVYSICISLLAGNKNIIRISSDINAETGHLLQSLRNAMEEEEHAVIRNYIQIINYPHSEEINAHISLLADARVLWGGDKTVETFRQFKTRPRCKDIVFPNRISYSLVDMRAFTLLKGNELDDWIKKFYNDSYIFNQKGCSSPQLLFLLNSDEQAEKKLYDALSELVKQKYEEDINSLASLKYNTLIGDIISDKAQTAVVDNNLVYLVQLTESDILPDNCGGGYFYFRRIKQLSQILPFINPASQTLTYMGLSNEQLQELNALLHGRGIDRIVETGNALKFNNFWDGYNLLDELTRKRYIEAKGEQ